MILSALRVMVLVAIALPGASPPSASAEDEDAVAMAAALKDATLTLQDGLKAGERQGQPISAQFEIDDGNLRLSIYTSKGEDFTEVVADPKTGAIVKSEKITDTDEITDAADQKAAMAKATVSLAAVVDMAVKENTGALAVAVFPDLRDGHPVADVTLLQGTTAKTVTKKLE